MKHHTINAASHHIYKSPKVWWLITSMPAKTYALGKAARARAILSLTVACQHCV